MSNNFKFGMDFAMDSNKTVLATVGKISSCKFLKWFKIWLKDICSDADNMSLGSCNWSSVKSELKFEYFFLRLPKILPLISGKCTYLEEQIRQIFFWNDYKNCTSKMIIALLYHND